ncbi:hypothetical protein M422DRAFT_49007 [Sphaerobolus stellatus SS14]|uniref:Uncharacterized protein n=1 Tax=Sphaerobolus stellatus (strain SS14) TaxID=990650 RepID=A0A0C9V159_SPHS4|nr:hypothetical protein M422DRAFT_49007 [Sphaerobolus stellatus SS14]
MSTASLEIALLKEFNNLMEEKYWDFLSMEWPYIKPKKYHRTDLRAVPNIDEVKKLLLKRLGPIPVFFFLTVIFPTKNYPGPYRPLEKGLLLLYHLVKGCSLEDMRRFITPSTFNDILSSFYKKDKGVNNALEDLISKKLHNMFSNI